MEKSSINKTQQHNVLVCNLCPCTNNLRTWLSWLESQTLMEERLYCQRQIELRMTLSNYCVIQKEITPQNDFQSSVYKKHSNTTDKFFSFFVLHFCNKWTTCRFLTFYYFFFFLLLKQETIISKSISGPYKVMYIYMCRLNNETFVILKTYAFTYQQSYQENIFYLLCLQMQNFSA